MQSINKILNISQFILRESPLNPFLQEMKNHSLNTLKGNQKEKKKGTQKNKNVPYIVHTIFHYQHNLLWQLSHQSREQTL